jgi:hypothetical protein
MKAGLNENSSYILAECCICDTVSLFKLTRFSSLTSYLAMKAAVKILSFRRKNYTKEYIGFYRAEKFQTFYFSIFFQNIGYII